MCFIVSLDRYDRYLVYSGEQGRLSTCLWEATDLVGWAGRGMDSEETRCSDAGIQSRDIQSNQRRQTFPEGK